MSVPHELFSTPIHRWAWWEIFAGLVINERLLCDWYIFIFLPAHIWGRDGVSEARRRGTETEKHMSRIWRPTQINPLPTLNFLLFLLDMHSQTLHIRSLIQKHLYLDGFWQERLFVIIVSLPHPEIPTSGPRLNIKTVLSTYGDFHVKDKTAVRTSYL